MAYILQKEGYEVPLDMAQLKKINDFFKPVRNDALKSGLLNPVVLTTQTDALNYQIPGGMLSNLVAQLTAQNKLDKLDEVLADSESPRRPRLSPARHPDEPDGRRPGNRERACG